jgi:hypothetical protein
VTKIRTSQDSPTTATRTTDPGMVVQAWVPSALARQIKARAEHERRSVSAVIRNAVEDRLTDGGPT